MAYSAFDDRSRTPDPDELSDVLDAADRLWKQLVSMATETFDPVSEDWTWSGKKWGWSLRLKRKKRAIVYLTPREGYFVAGFALGEKAVDASRTSDLPPHVVELIDSAQKYAEGRAVRIDVRESDDVDHVLLLAELKMAN